MPGTVLVVEDDRELRELVRRYLERAGHAVHTTGSGAEAIVLLDTGGVDLVVLDLGLPDVDGLDVLAAVRGGREVPVVVLTARATVRFFTAPAAPPPPRPRPHSAGAGCGSTRRGTKPTLMAHGWS